MSGVAVRFRHVREEVRASLWPSPTAAVVVAVLAGVALPRLDAAVAPALPAWLNASLFGGGAAAARTVLDAIASSLITVTSLTFSLTVVTLQLASSQFSPRLLRNFTRDRVVHATLALFLGTFTFALTVLRTVRSPEEGGSAFVPQISVTVAFALTAASVIALVTFLSHLTRQIRVETVLEQVHAEARTSSARVLDGRRPRPADEQVARAWLPGRAGAPLRAALPGSVPLPAAGSGFVVRIDEQALLAAAEHAGAVVVIERAPGEHVVAGTPLGAAAPAEGGSLEPEALAQLRERAGRAVTLGAERTAVQDVAFGLRQLTDVAVKALSPGINDPTTAVHALGHSSALLCELAAHHLGPTVLREGDGDDGDDRGDGPVDERSRDAVERGPLRVVLAGPDLADLLELAVSQPRRYGAAEPDVLARLFALLGELAWCAGPAASGAVTEQTARLRATCEAQGFDQHEQARLTALAAQVEAAVQGRWRP